MTVKDIILALTSGDAEAILSTAEAAAAMLEEMEERIAIMGETLTDKEWEDTKTEAQQRAEDYNRRF